VSGSEETSGASSFAQLLSRFSYEASIGLGLVPNPLTEKVEVNLIQAKHVIDILEMLRTKTEGNRTDEETKLLMTVLYDLRMQYVSKSRGTPSE
jgi:hypothetical protein